MGWHHARVLSLLKDANLIGVADPNEERGKLAIEQFQCEWFKDYKDLIPKVDAICIAVPTLLLSLIHISEPTRPSQISLE